MGGRVAATNLCQNRANSAIYKESKYHVSRRFSALTLTTHKGTIQVHATQMYYAVSNSKLELSTKTYTHVDD